ncbi:haloacid dehalogenase-like hydrolase [[Clostridium] innocuum]|nr:haloacid dehalogenase-like hydrolase [[Clostridium] innocuum]MCR0576934.1 haloacid dehalogenase-like hydrolase [[Clostridium] innocuum]
MKRLLSSTASELAKMSKEEKLTALRTSEGRVIVSEMTMNGAPDALDNASIGELYAAFGADMLLLNKFDVFHPYIQNISVKQPNDCIRALKKYTGKLIGLNLEPVPESSDLMTEQILLCKGRKASVESAKKAVQMGVDYIVLTGNPDTGVSNDAMISATRKLKEAVGNEVILITGKMHAAGSLKEAGTNIISKKTIQELVSAGSDVILLPAPGCVPGITLEYAADLISYCHTLGVMTMTAIGTSQEDADAETLRHIALLCKMSGTDLHHIGDAGHAGCVAESIMTYSIAIRGKRHTYNRMASSVMR